MNNSVDVLVTGTEKRQGLAVLRALGAQGVRVCAAGARLSNFGFFSRYARARCRYPSPMTDKLGFCQEILRAVRQYNIPVVLPVLESTVIALDEHRDLFSGHTKLVLPPAKALEYALDKQKTYEMAESLGIAIPRTGYPASRAEAMDFARQTGFPLIAKPRAYGSYSKSGSAFNFKVLYLRDTQALEDAIGRFERLGAFPMLQQYCHGLSVPQSTFCISGEIIGICQHRRGRDNPLSGGVASVVISEPLDPQLLAWTQKIVKALQWDGVAQFEYRVDPATGQKFLFEINGRIWAPVSAAIQWGLNFPYALYQYARFGTTEHMPAAYPLEKHCRYLRGDLMAWEGHLLGMNAHAVTQLPGKFKITWDIIKDFRPAVQSDVWSWRDPLPSLYEYMNLAGRYTAGSAYHVMRYAAHRLLHPMRYAPKNNSLFHRLHRFLQQARLPATARRAHRKDWLGLPEIDPGAEHVVQAGIAWLRRAQAASLTKDGGVARHYSLIDGWSTSYPETTGYIVPTLLSYARRTGSEDVRRSARRMLDWLVSIQLPEGGFQGGLIDSTPVVPVTFNTGQILLGLAAGAAEFNEPYRAAMLRAADWLVRTQDPDGCWRRHATPFAAPGEKVYETHVAWGLLEAARVAPEKGYAQAALRNVQWALSFQKENGWFAQCCLTDPQRPLTHTLGYVLRGVLEAYRFTKDAALLRACMKTADGLLSALRSADGYLPGRLTSDWQGAVPWVCLTGNAQIAYCWLTLFELTGHAPYLDAALSANRYVRRTVVTDERKPDIYGAVKGSFPVNGAYGRYQYLNWACKFTIDANMRELDLSSSGMEARAETAMHSEG